MSLIPIAPSTPLLSSTQVNSSSESATESGPISHGSVKRLLLVDDEPNVLRALVRLFRREGYEIDTASNGPEALALLATTSYQLIVSDQRMPGMTGTELLTQVRKQYPDTVRVILSGYADIDSILGAINQGHIYQFQTKPWNDAELKDVVRHCMAHHDFLQERKQLAKHLQRENQYLMSNTQYLMQFMVSRLVKTDICQEVLDDFPLPAIGVSSDQRLFFVSDITRMLFPSLERAESLDHITDCLPEVIIEVIERCSYYNQFLPQHIRVDDLELRLNFYPLESKGSFFILLEVI